jgi:hypothetical protein
MQAVTEKWKENRNRPLTSEGFVEIVYAVNDPNAVTAAYGTQQHELSPMPLGWNPPLTDETAHTVVPYATLEQNQWLLDGSRVTVPGSGEYGYSGYISHYLCDASGSFENNPSLCGTAGIHEGNPCIQIEFQEQVSILPGITITWSSVFDDYPEVFKITTYDEHGNTLDSKEVRDNTGTVSKLAFEMMDFDRIDIEVIRWGTPHRRARIERIFLGLTKTYTKTSLMKFDSTQTIDLLSSSLPKSEVSFEVDNRDGTFDPQNTEGLSKYMMERQEILTRYGFRTGAAPDEIEWIPGGVYYLSDWSAPQNGLSATFKARDLLGFLNNTYYKGRFPHVSEPGGISLHTLALEVLGAANLPQRKTDTGADYNAPWELDEETLGSFKTAAPLPVCTLGECLQMIANAACCTIFFDRDGILHIAKLDDYRNHGEKLIINDRNSYSKPEINLTKPVKQIDVSMYSFTRENDTKSIYEGTLPLEPGRNEFIIEYSDIAENVQAAEITGATLNTGETKYYAKSCKLVLNSSNNQTVDCTIIMTGNVRKPTETIITVPNLPSGETQPLRNTLITSAEHAVQAGKWLRDNLNRRTHMSVDWRADPGLDAGDIVKVGTSGQNIRVVSSNFSFSGAFKGKAEGVEIQ